MTRCSTWLGFVVLVACAAAPGAAPRPAAIGPDASRVDRQRAADEARLRLSEELRRLGGAAEGDSGAPGSAAPFDGDEGLGQAIFGAHTPPEQELRETFTRYCQATEAAARQRGAGYTRLTLRGVERRSGATCVLVADLPSRGRWRYVLHIDRVTSP